MEDMEKVTRALSRNISGVILTCLVFLGVKEFPLGCDHFSFFFSPAKLEINPHSSGGLCLRATDWIENKGR